jgi:ketosteroid isomerase-like protein
VFDLLDASGTARDGVGYRNTYMWLMDMRDGRIVRVQALLDSVAFNELWHRVAP